MRASEEARSVAAGAMLFLVVNIAVKASYAAGILLLASLLPPAEYASYGLLYALQSAATMLAAMGLVEITAGRLRHHAVGAARKSLFQDVTGLFLLTALAGSLVLVPIALWLSGRGLGPAILPAALLGVVTGFSVLQASFHRIDERLAVSLVSSAGVPLAAIVGVLAGAIWFGDLIMVFGLGLVGAVAVIGGLAVAGEIYRPHFLGREGARAAVIEIAPFLAIGVFGWASGYGMTLVIDWRFTPVDVAAFTFLYTAASVAQVVASSMNMVWAPRFYRLFNGGHVERVERQSGMFFAVLACTLGVTGFVSVAALPWLTKVVGGHLAGYGQFRMELALLLSGYVFTTLFWHGQNYFLVTGRGRELMTNTLWSGGVSLAIWLVCLFVLGPEGAYVGFLLQMAIKSAYIWVYSRRHWPIRPWWTGIAVAAMVPFAALWFPAP